MSRLCTIAFTVLSVLVPLGLNAQQTPEYTLESLMDLYYQSDSYYSIISDSLIYDNNRRLFRIQTLPTLDLSATLANLNNSISPVIQPDGQEIFVDRFYSNSNVSLSASQLLPFTGGKLMVTSSVVRLDNFSPSKTKAYSLNMFNVAYSQNLSGYNSYRWEKKKNEAESRLNDVKLIQSRESSYRQIADLFFNMLAAQEEYRILEESEALAKYMMEKAELFYESGRISYEDYLDAKIDFKRATIRHSREEIDHAREQLISYLNMDDQLFSVVFMPSDTSHIREGINNVNEEMINDRVSLFSVDLEKRITSIEDSLKLKQIKSAAYPSISFSFGGGLNSRSEEFVQLFGKYNSRMNASVSLSIPILDWGRNKLQYRNRLAYIRKRDVEYKTRIASLKNTCHHDIASISTMLQEIEAEEELIGLLKLKMESLKKNAEYGRIDMSEISKVRANLIQSQLQNVYRLKEIFSIIYKYRQLSLIDIRGGMKML